VPMWCVASLEMNEGYSLGPRVQSAYRMQCRKGLTHDLFTAQHVSNVSTSILRSLRLIVDLFHVLYCSVRIEVLALASLFSGE